MEEIRLAVDGVENRFEALAAARKKLPPDAILLAWFDRSERIGGPQGPGPVSEQYLDDYSRSRGAKAKVVVNERFALFFVPPSAGA